MHAMRTNRKATRSQIVDGTRFTQGSENIFADLGLDNPDEWMVKAELARQIAALVRGKTQKEIARTLGIHQPKVSALLRGKLKDFSVDRLLAFLRALGHSVEIRIRPRQVAEVPYLLPGSVAQTAGGIPANPYAALRIQFVNPEPNRFQ